MSPLAENQDILLPPLLTPQQVARELAVSVSAVYELCNAGLLLHRRVGVRAGRIRIARFDLDRYLTTSVVEVYIKQATPPTRSTNIANRRTTDNSLGANLLRAAGWKG